MNFIVILVILLILAGVGVGIYFTMNGGAKKCDEVTVQADCKAPCKWDTYGYKCIGEKDPMTPKPIQQDDSSTSAKTEGNGDAGAVAGSDKWKCYAGRYGDAYEEYLKNKSLDDVKEHYETVGKAKGWNTSCTLTPDEAGCYTLQNPEVFENFGYTLDSRYNKNQRKHYLDVGRDKVARFNCQGGALAASEIPENASILTPRELTIDRRNKKYANWLKSPNGLYTLRIYFENRRGRIIVTKGNQGYSEVTPILDSTVSQADYDAGYTNLRAWLDNNGLLYMRWYKENGSWNDYKSAVYASTNVPESQNTQVKSNQHALVLTDSGKLYVDHGLGSEDEVGVLRQSDDE